MFFTLFTTKALRAWQRQQPLQSPQSSGAETLDAFCEQLRNSCLATQSLRPRLRSASAMGFVLVKFMNHVNFMHAPFNARDCGDEHCDEKEYFVNSDAQRNGDRYQDGCFP
ncbi:MAG TPA: hypothetical protein VKS98_03825 [Chthoniobacterales bacterium]|nr:hypothetical protein [Chthoniobacterales bacterium]